MSLRHLYLDLNHLGTYPDIITCTGLTPSGETINIPRYGHSKMNKYYGPVLTNTEYMHVMMNDKIIASIKNTGHREGRRIKVRGVKYTTSLSNPMIVRQCNSVMIVECKRRLPISFNALLISRYREIINLDSLYEIIKDILR